MKRLGLVLILAMATSTLTVAQSKDFAGSWVIDAEKTGHTSGPPAVTIVMTKTEFKVKMGADPEEAVFKLDGAETVLASGARTKAVWKGNKLEATFATDRGGQSLTFSREAAWLVIERQSSRGPMKIYLKKAPSGV
jgi:hypothetical protein